MKNDRLRVPVDDPYVECLGRCAYVFASLEWNAAHCCERMQRNYLNKLGKKTAGDIASDLLRLAKRRPDITLRGECTAAAVEFRRLVKMRNSIVHARPGTASNGEQRLFHMGKPWSVEMINDISDEYTACGLVLNDLLHHRL